MSERTKARTLYVVGYLAALGLTGGAFAAVRWRLLPPASLFGLVLVLGAAQMVVHFRFFLHIGLKRSSRHDLQLILFSALIISLMTSGTLVILENLRRRMM
jgi:heme/copper-type cytochrome/quinol oxidase subunit 4